MEKGKVLRSSVIEKFHKRFAFGEQYLEITEDGRIQETEKAYAWQERAVYNHILPIIEKYKSILTESDLYGRHGLVARLIPFQRAYNAIKNRELEYINRITMGVLAVEDGSVDLDELEQGELQKGKALVYRQGAAVPQIEFPTMNTVAYIVSGDACIKQMNSMAEDFALLHGYDKDKKN